jgi:GxxExxY protein
MDVEQLPDFALTHSIIGAFYEVYNRIGYGLIESLYAAMLERELRGRGHAVTREFAVQVFYKGEAVGFQRLDMVVDSKVVVEIKSTAQLHPMFRRQLLCYLHCTNLKLGLLLHFGPEPKVIRLHGRGGAFGPGST